MGRLVGRAVTRSVTTLHQGLGVVSPTQHLARISTSRETRALSRAPMKTLPSLLLALFSLGIASHADAQEVHRSNKQYELDLSVTPKGVHLNATFTIQADGSAKLHVNAQNHSILDNGEPRVQLEALDATGAVIMTLSAGELIPPRGPFTGPTGRDWEAHGKLTPGTSIASIRWSARNVGSSWIVETIKLASKVLIQQPAPAPKGRGASR
jgi:hypothetical protein